MAYFETALGPSSKIIARISSMRLCQDSKAIRRSRLSSEQNIDLQTVHGEMGTDHVTQIEQDQPGIPQQTSMGWYDPPLEDREAKDAWIAA